MCDSLLHRVEPVQHKIESSLEDTRPIHSAPYRAGRKARKLEKKEIAKMLGLEGL